MSDKKQPSAAEAMFFYAIVKHTKNKADIDWNGVAEENGFKNAEVAKVRFGQIKRKLGISDTSPKKPKAAGGAGTGGGCAGSSPLKTGSKVTKKAATPRKKAVKKEKNEHDNKDDDDDDNKVDRKQKVKKETSDEHFDDVDDFIFEDDFDPGHQLEMEMMG